MNRDQAPDDVIRDWLEEEAFGQLPDWVLVATFERTRAGPQRTAWSRWGDPMTLILRRPRTAPALRSPWLLILATFLALALMGGAVIVGARLLATAPPNKGPLAVAMPPTACPPGTILKSGDIATIAGTGGSGSSGDGGPATAAVLSPSYAGIAFGPDGDIYLSDGPDIRRITSDGTISTFAGPATHAAFTVPMGLTFAPDGALYIGDWTSGHLWRLDPDGSYARVAGTGDPGTSGNGGPAVDAQVAPVQTAIGPAGDIYFDDENNYRRIDPAGIVHAYAGTLVAGYSGDGGPAVDAGIGNNVEGVAADAAGNVYLGDRTNHRIRRVDPDGIITTFVGTGVPGSTGDGGPAADAEIDSPVSLALDEAGQLYFSDQTSATVRMVDTAGVIHTVAGTGRLGFLGDCGPATAAQLNAPWGLAVRDGVVLISDEQNHRIRMVVP